MRTAMLVLALLIPISSARAEALAAPNAAPADPSATVRPAPPEMLDPNVFHCGPIHSKDPATRARIEQLYRQQWDLRQATQARLQELVSRAKLETDSAAQLELNREGGRIKQEEELRRMQLGLEIARLDGDASRVAEFELALDQVQHPEKYAPTSTPDPELRARRQRERGE
ncbi:MAG TPA: hypothetical protein VJW75_05570 [Candidatus Eisenbacteria bacterium]|nr:hypothetical protein [Candidatus Eisenbacteria bacterium]